MQTSASAPTSRAVPGDGVTLRARDWGGSGQAVALLHGLASNARIWDGVAPRLVGAGLRVVALDQRGHGESEQPDDGYDFATLGQDLSSTLAGLCLERPLLVGHSWGASVALQYAADRPGALAGLALVDGGLLGVAEWAGPTREDARRRLAPPRFAVPLADWLARAGRFDAGGSGGQSWVRDFLRAGVEVDDRGVARARFRYDNHLQVVDALHDQRPPDLYPLVDCPVLLCPAGDGDLTEVKRAAVDRALRLLPSAHVTWFEDTMHDIPLQRPAELAAELARFAQEVSGRG
ncbi:MAG TPA: alpha/beta hydrolase [Actinomycetota bacterium]|jgi:pimeloyl-ACP methyl ester carboxylesterase|nr:alpha/beta hydrolase [Actinomycetota bacterium]